MSNKSDSINETLEGLKKACENSHNVTVKENVVRDRVSYDIHCFQIDNRYREKLITKLLKCKIENAISVGLTGVGFFDEESKDKAEKLYNDIVLEYSNDIQKRIVGEGIDWVVARKEEVSKRGSII